MSDLKTIKRRILREDKLEPIYEAMGCDHFKSYNNRVEAGLPEHFHSTNNRAVQTKLNDHLTSSIRNKSDFSGDIFSLISYLVHGKRGEELQKDLPNAKRFVCETLGWREFLEGGEYESRTDYLAPLKAILKGKQRKREVKPNPILPESILDEYLPYPSHHWLEEGISLHTQRQYGVRFDLESKRIILPMRNRFGQLVGVKGRILRDEDAPKMKYLYLYPFNNSQELFNFHFAHSHILLHKRVYVFEGEKSSMKMFDAGLYNAVAIGSSDVTDVQVDMLKQCGLDVEIVLCYDNDKTPEEILNVAESFTGRNVFAIVDTLGLLPEKSSPIDAGKKTFLQLETDCCYDTVALQKMVTSAKNNE